MYCVARCALMLVASSALVNVALAADLPPRIMHRDVYPESDVWTGCYAGLVGGVTWGDSRHRNSSGAPITPQFDISGGALGGELGCNYRVQGPWVVGFAGDVSWTNKQGDVSNLPAFDPDILSGTKENWFSTQRVRIGWAQQRWLLYVTGGLAVADIEANVTRPTGEFVSETRTRWGYTVGAGVEGYWAPGWSAKLEYLFIDYGKQNYFTPPPDGFADRGGGVSVTNHLFRAGVNYHFNAPFWIRGF